jgi:hypothetical protein
MLTKIGVLLDATGSMVPDRYRTIDGFNEYLKGIKADDATRDALLTVAKFNSHIGVHVMRREEPVHAVPELTPEDYVCDYVTPLFDATAQMIGLLERGASAERYLLIIMTDGQNNASREVTFSALNKLIEEKRAKGNWTFVFLGADLDAWAAQQAMGVQIAPAGNTMSYNKAQSAQTYTLVASATTNWAGSTRAASETFFTDGKSGEQAVVSNALTPEAVAGELGIKPSALAKMRERGQGPAYTRVGHRTVRYARTDVDDWKKARTITTDE